MGVIVNVITVVVGSILGLLLKKKISPKVAVDITCILGISTVIMGIVEIIPTMITIEDGKLTAHNSIILIISMVLGYVIGHLLKIDDRLEILCNYVTKKIGKDDISQGFISASILFCVGALTITGSIMDGLGNPNVLFIKSVMDFIAAIILSATLGYGVIFSAITVLLYQGTLALCASFLNTLIPLELMNLITMVGYAVVIVIGLNLIKITKIKTGNLLPVILVPILYYLITLLF